MGDGDIETNKLTLRANESNNNYAGLYFKSFDENHQVNRNEPFIRCYGTGTSESSGGDAVVIGNGGLTVIGSGESPTALYDYYQNEGTYVPSSETLLLTSDNNTLFVTGANTIDNRRVLRMTTSGGLYFDAWKADITKANNDVAERYSHSYCVVDKNGNFLSWLETHAETDGTVDLVCKARNYGTGSAVSHGFALGIANNGTRVVNFDQPSAWITGLGLDPVTVNVTASSGFNAGGMRVARVGRLVTINGNVSITASKVSNKWHSIFTGAPVPSSIQKSSCLVWTNNAGTPGEIKVETNGQVYVWPTVALGTSGEIDFSISYIAAS